MPREQDHVPGDGHAGHAHDRGHGQGHDEHDGHSHGIEGRGDWQVGAAVATNLILTAAQIVGGVIAGSVALIADAMHNLSDAGTSLAVILSGALVVLYDWRPADPLITIAISAWILWHCLSEIGPVIRILMLGAPDGIADADQRAAVTAGAAGVHHLHLWQIDEKRASLEAHLVLAEGAEAAEVLGRVKARVAARFGIAHSTFDVERDGGDCAGQVC